MASKNSKSNRGAGVYKRMLDGKRVIPSLYIGDHIEGHGRFMAGKIEFFEADLILDKNGKPVPFKEIGKLEIV